MSSAIPDSYDVVWDTPSSTSAESMPCGGGDIGLNVRAEDGDVLFYLDRSGSFDENNQQLKHGRIRLTLDPNPLVPGCDFRQTLKLREGCVDVDIASPEVSTQVRIWVEVHRPVIRVEVRASAPLGLRVAYENWRMEHRYLQSWSAWPATASPGPLRSSSPCARTRMSWRPARPRSPGTTITTAPICSTTSF